MQHLGGIIRRAACALLFVALALPWAGMSPARAASTLHVTTCSGNVGTTGSLPAQVAAAASGDTIVFDLNCLPVSPVTLVATLTPAVNLTIDGAGHTVAIDGGCTLTGGTCTSGTGVTVFTVNAGRTIGLTGLTIQHGSAASSRTAALSPSPRARSRRTAACLRAAASSRAPPAR